MRRPVKKSASTVKKTAKKALRPAVGKVGRAVAAPKRAVRKASAAPAKKAAVKKAAARKAPAAPPRKVVARKAPAASAKKSAVAKAAVLPAKPAPARSAPAKRMLREDRERYRKLLQREKERLFKTLGYFEEDGEDDKSKDVGGVPTHIADLGTDVFEKNLELDLSNSEGKILALINEAIEKIGGGSFGTCEMCGAGIPRSRLEALPYAKLCIKCQRTKEQSGE